MSTPTTYSPTEEPTEATLEEAPEALKHYVCIVASNVDGSRTLNLAEVDADGVWRGWVPPGTSIQWPGALSIFPPTSLEVS